MAEILVHIAVIEWAADDAEPPSVFASTEWREVALKAGAEVAGHDEHDDAGGFLAENKWLGTEMSDAKLQEWHEGYRESTTSPWVTFYERVV